MTIQPIVTEDMITAALEGWFGDEVAVFPILRDRQRAFMRRALERALAAAPYSREEDR